MIVPVGFRARRRMVIGFVSDFFQYPETEVLCSAMPSSGFFFALGRKTDRLKGR